MPDHPERRIPKKLGIHTTRFTIRTEDLHPDLTDDWTDADLSTPIFTDASSILARARERQQTEYRTLGQTFLPIFASAIERALRSGNHSLKLVNPNQRTESLSLSFDTSEENADDPVVEISWSLYGTVANLAINPTLLSLFSPLSAINDRDLATIGEAWADYGAVIPDLEPHLPTIARHLTHAFRTWPTFRK